MSFQGFMEWLRGRHGDRIKAMQTVQLTQQARTLEVLRDYEAFIPHARRIRDGLLVGTASASEERRIPIRLPWGDEHTHWLVQGGTGTGKTTWVASLLRQELAAGRSVGVLDYKGDLFKAAIQWAAVAATGFEEERRRAFRDRLVVVNPFSDTLVPMNVCRLLPGTSAEAQAYEVTLALSRLFDSSLGSHMESVLRHLLLLLVEAGLSLVEAPLLLQNEVLRGLLARRSTIPSVKEFFLGTYAAVPQVSKDALLSRLQGLLLPENLRLMLGAEEMVDFRRTFEDGTPLFAFFGRGPGVPEEQVEVLGSLFFQLLLQATYARGSGQRPPYLLMLDEFVHALAAPHIAQRFETALTTVRSFGLSLVLIHHNFAQIPPALRETMLANCTLTSLFRTSARNADPLADILPEIDPESLAQALAAGGFPASESGSRGRRLEALQRLETRCFWWYDRRKPYRAIRLRAPYLPSPHEAIDLSSQTLEERIEKEGWSRGGAAVPRRELAATIEARAARLRALVREHVRPKPPQGQGSRRSPLPHDEGSGIG